MTTCIPLLVALSIPVMHPGRAFIPVLAAPAQYLIHALLTLQGNYNLVLKIDISPEEYHHRT